MVEEHLSEHGRPRFIIGFFHLVALFFWGSLLLVAKPAKGAIQDYRFIGDWSKVLFINLKDSTEDVFLHVDLSDSHARISARSHESHCVFGVFHRGFL